MQVMGSLRQNFPPGILVLVRQEFTSFSLSVWIELSISYLIIVLSMYDFFCTCCITCVHGLHFFSKNYLFSFEIGIDCSVPKLAYGAHGLLIFQVLWYCNPGMCPQLNISFKV